MIFRRI